MAVVTNFKGKLVFDTSKPDGTPRKLMDVSRLQGMGWKASISLNEGLEDAYQWFVKNASSVRG
jgi:GDP-L-fucose synthase